LVILGHPNKFNPSLSIRGPSHDAQVNSHGAFGVEMDAELDSLARF
jgi:hypothetical protein